MRPSAIPTLFLLLMSGHGAVQADQGADPAAKVDGQQTAETRSPRLRFRSRGPACMCLGGLSEADIQAAQNRPETGPETLESIVRDQ